MGCFSKFLAFFAPAGHRGSEGPGNGNTQERRRHVRSVVNVFLHGVGFTAWATSVAHQTNRIDLQKQCSSAALGRAFWVENVRLPKNLLKRVDAERALMEQLTQVRRRSVRCGNSKKHGQSQKRYCRSRNTFGLRSIFIFGYIVRATSQNAARNFRTEQEDTQQGLR